MIGLMFGLIFGLIFLGEIHLEKGLTLEYEIEGEGPALLLINGMGSHLEVWDDTVKDLVRDFRVIRFNHRGIGRSGRLEGPYGVDRMAEDAADLMTALHIPRYAVAGISLGGFVAQALARQQPKRLTALVLVATSLGGADHIAPDPEVLTYFQTMFTMTAEERARRGLSLALHPDFAAAKPVWFEERVAFMIEHPPPPATVQAQVLAAMVFQGRDKAESIRVPTLILHGDADRIVPSANGEKLAATIPGSRLIFLKKAGHLCIIDAAPATARAITDFLQETLTTSPAQ